MCGGVSVLFTRQSRGVIRQLVSVISTSDFRSFLDCSPCFPVLHECNCMPMCQCVLTCTEKEIRLYKPNGKQANEFQAGMGMNCTLFTVQYADRWNKSLSLLESFLKKKKIEEISFFLKRKATHLPTNAPKYKLNNTSSLYKWKTKQKTNKPTKNLQLAFQIRTN